jgi:hypothetical protein
MQLVLAIEADKNKTPVGSQQAMLPITDESTNLSPSNCFTVVLVYMCISTRCADKKNLWHGCYKN